MSSPSSQHLVLVFGTSGFLGSEVTLHFLRAGFRVRGTVRSQDKADKWEKKHGNFDGKLEWAIVKDIAEPGAFDEAIKGVDLVAHTASPFHYDVKDNEKDMLLPALEGTRQILRAAQKEPSVKRVVVTSSFAAILDWTKGLGPDMSYDHTSWNPATYEQAKNADKGQEGFIYCASKKLAEEEAWKIAKEPDSKWKLTTICPPLISGPPPQVIESLDSLNTSSGILWNLVDQKEVPLEDFPFFVDVRDGAKLHVDAVTKEEAAGERFFCVAGHYSKELAADIARKAFPDQASRILEPTADKVSDNADQHCKVDASHVEKVLGVKWISLEDSVKDTLAELFKIEKELKQ